MEQPFGGFVQIDVASFHEIRKDIRIVLRSAHLTQLEQVANQGQELTTSQTSMLNDHRRMSARGKSVAKLDTANALANAEQRLTATPQVASGSTRRRSITESVSTLFARTPRVRLINIASTAAGRASLPAFTPAWLPACLPPCLDACVPASLPACMPACCMHRIIEPPISIAVGWQG